MKSEGTTPIASATNTHRQNRNLLHDRFGWGPRLSKTAHQMCLWSSALRSEEPRGGPLGTAEDRDAGT